MALSCVVFTEITTFLNIGGLPQTNSNLFLGNQRTEDQSRTASHTKGLFFTD